MLLIEGRNIKKSYGERLILDVDDIKIYSEDRIGIVGLNGVGKTTLMNILAGKEKPDEGFVKTYGSTSYITQLEASEKMGIESSVARHFRVNNIWTETMSGGEKTRYKLAEALAENNSLILADEPTSNLDIEGVIQLEKSFKTYTGALVIIAHDREFLDKLCNKIIEIENTKIKCYKGNYSQYSDQRLAERERMSFEFHQYEKERQKLERVIDNTKQKSKTIKNTPTRMGNSEARLHKMGNQKAKGKLDKTIKRITSRIERLEVKENPKEIKLIKLDLQATEELHGKMVLSGKNIDKSFDSKQIFSEASFQIYNRSKTVLLGANGSGKSTLIKMIMAREESIKVGKNLKIGYFSQDMNLLIESKSIIENVMEESIYDETFARIMLSRLLIRREEVYKKVKVLSGGERVKVSFAKMLLQDINLLILDEPTNYLDIYSMEAVEQALIDYDKTVLFVSHDRHFISAVADNVLLIENNKLKPFNGTYKEYLASEEKSTETTREEINNKILILQNKCSELIGRLSIPGKNDNVELLDLEYHAVLSELKELKGGY